MHPVGVSNRHPPAVVSCTTSKAFWNGCHAGSRLGVLGMLERQLRWRLHSERHNRGLDGAAVRALVVVQRQVGAGRVTLDGGDAHWFAASRTGLTDMKLHGNTLSASRRNRRTAKKGPWASFMRRPGRFAMASQPTGRCSLNGYVVQLSNVGPVTLTVTLA